jgi:hypothetical protein
MKRTVIWRNKFFSVGMIIFLTLFIVACGSSGWGPESKPGTAPTITSADNTVFTIGTAGTFTISATGDPTPTFALTGTLPTGVTFDTTTGVLSGTPATGTNGTYPLTITASNGISLDATQNFTLTVSSMTPFNTSCLPLHELFGTSYGSFTFDVDGNLLFEANNAREIRLLDRDTCEVTTVATGVAAGGYALLGMTYDQGSIFVGDVNGNIYKINPTTGSSTVLTTISVGQYINGLVIAPATFSPYRGQLIVAAYNGNIFSQSTFLYAVDQSVASPTPVLIANVGTIASALIFGSEGTLYLADSINDKILTVTAAGVVSDFVTTGLSAPNGLAFDTNAGLLYVASSGDQTVKSVTIPGGSIATITSVFFNGGWYPSPIIYDATSNILLIGADTNPGSLTIVNYNL